jgi:hypothetical protein
VPGSGMTVTNALLNVVLIAPSMESPGVNRSWKFSRPEC